MHTKTYNTHPHQAEAEPLDSIRVYFAPFHAMSEDLSPSPCGSTIAAFNKAVSRQDWPYDNGDDPSFYAMQELRGRLSWGVCRQDVRNRLRREDIVVFFSFRKFEETTDCEYRLCAVATVERRVRQIDLWGDDSNLRVFTRYLNLLVRPSRSARGRWEHFEPALQGSRLHRDWLWRIADHGGFRKQDFKKLEDTDEFEPGATIRGRPVVVAENYVLFWSDVAKTHVLSKPLIVAWHSKGKAAEDWNSDNFSQAVRRMTLDVAARANGRKRSVRIRNSQPHRHIVFELPESEAQTWRTEFLNLIRNR